ncbi:cupin domain-containing protein [Sunxiuqinia indica]|uniref:cupin domain-containing protein n=1 Tax=Sunxiuqinia indica TaxID=2692584 RepID=UPI001359FB26|nr:cupin domain-containing protein [Sunxiuqinia indica]
MKIMHEQLNIKNESSLKVKWDDFPHFTFPWHFHPEYQLVYVIESFGTRFIGNSVENFEAGDLVLLGSNVPHFWKNNELFHRNDPQYKDFNYCFKSLKSFSPSQYRKLYHLNSQVS